LCRFSDAGNDDLTTRSTAAVRKGPRHEIAGSESRRRPVCREGYGDLDARLKSKLAGNPKATSGEQATSSQNHFATRCPRTGRHMRFSHLRRREFVTLLRGATAWPLAARAHSSRRCLLGERAVLVGRIAHGICSADRRRMTAKLLQFRSARLGRPLPCRPMFVPSRVWRPDVCEEIVLAAEVCAVISASTSRSAASQC
jgi:hypothetical protein